MEVRFGHRVIALFRSQDSKLALPALSKVLSQQSLRRAFVGRVITLACRTGLGLLVIRPLAAPSHPEFGARLQEWQDMLRCKILHPLILLPPQGLSRGRFYVQEIAVDGRSSHFTKIGMTPENHRQLSCEAETLLALEAQCTPRFRVPLLIERLEVRDWQSLTVQVLPDSAKPLDLDDPRYEEALAWYCGPTSAERVGHLMRSAWWQAFENKVGGRAPAFMREIAACADRTVTVGRAHGDAGPHNFLCDGNTIWIVDWESSTAKAPILVDRIALELGAKRKQVMAKPKAYLQKFTARHSASEAGQCRRNLMLALAFRAASGHQEATELIEAWESRGDE